MNTTESTKVKQTREATVSELVAAFEGKYVNISPSDHYGISINMQKATLELEECDCSELYLVSRDEENRVTASICIAEDSIESVEEYDSTYTLNFSFSITGIEISEYKLEGQDLIPIGKFKDKEENIIQVCKDEGVGEIYIDEKSSNPVIVEDQKLIKISEIEISED